MQKEPLPALESIILDTVRTIIGGDETDTHLREDDFKKIFTSLLTKVPIRTKIKVRIGTNGRGGVTIENKKEMFDRFHKHWSEINAAYERYARSIGISYSALQALCEIYHSDSAVTQRMICETAHLPKTTVNAIIAGFVKQGYVELKEMEDDRRQKGICLTDEGRAYAEPIMEYMDGCEMLAFEMLDDTAIQAMISGIEAYQKNFNEKLNQTDGGK